jgi:hypothetical protein
MIPFVLRHLSVFPAWLQLSTSVLCGLVVNLFLIAWVVKILQTPSMQKQFESLWMFFARIGRYLAEQMKDPIARPRAERIACYIGIGIAYVMSGMLVFIAVSFTVLWALMHSRISFSNTLMLFAFIFLCWYMAAVLKAQGGRERMLLWAPPRRERQ